MARCCASGLSTDRLFWHTLVALVVALSGVVAPILLFFRKEWGPASLVLGVVLLAVGCGALLASAIARGVESSSCCYLQWKAMLLSAWLLNPVVLVAASILCKEKEWGWWSTMPLLVVLMVLSGRARLSDGGPRWEQEGCPWGPSTVFYWLLNRAVFLGFPLYFLSLQVTLYLPHKEMLPDGAEVGLFVCGGLIVTSMKFCAICACLSPSERPEGGPAKVSQAFILLIFLLLDWLSIVQLVFSPNTITDQTKERCMLAALLMSGLVQLRVTLARLQLRARWKRSWAQRRTRQIGAARDLELGEQLAAGAAAGGDSSDSDDDRGPGSVPTGFHEALMSVIGVPEPEARREWLSPPRRAAVVEARPQPGQQAVSAETEQAPLPPPPGASPSTTNATTPGDAGPTASLEISQPPVIKIAAELRHCAVCQDNINSGDQVRPMPKCNHVFHSACLEGWAKIKQEKTRCPVCRRPALNRKPTDGATHVSSLRGESGQASGRSGSTTGASGSESSSSRRTASERRAGRRPQFDTRNVRSVLEVSALMAEAALDCTNGGDTQAIALILEHRSFLDEVYPLSGLGRSVANSDTGVANAILEANSNLSEHREQVQSHLVRLYRSGRLRRTPWQRMDQNQQREVFRVILEDVAERRRRTRTRSG